MQNSDREVHFQVSQFFEPLERYSCKTGDLHRCSVDLDFCINPSKPTISRVRTGCAQVDCAARARARPRAREPPESACTDLSLP